MKMDVRIVILDSLEYSGDKFHSRSFPASHIDVTADQLLIRVKCRFCLFHQIYHFLRLASQIGAFFCKRNLFLPSYKQLFSQLCFQFHHLLGKRRLGNVQSIGGFRYALFSCYGKEIGKQSYFNHGITSFVSS